MPSLGPVLAGRGQHVTTRRISAGVQPAPGAAARRLSWWSHRDWLENDVDPALAARPDVLQRHHVSRDATRAVAGGMAVHADRRTGRDCRPTNERLVEALRLSLSTVQRARRALKELGLVVELVAGRSIMTLAERLAAHARFSRHRRIAAEFALCSLRRRHPKVRRNPQPDLPVVDGDTPPVGKVVRTDLTSRSTRLQRQTENCEEERAPRAAPTKGVRRRRGVDPDVRGLVLGVQEALPWLRGESPQRLTPLLTGRARAGWTVRDVVLTVRDRHAARGWRYVPQNLARPAGYLARLLEGVDLEDRPTVLEDHLAQLDAAQRAYDRRRATGAPCEHGVPAGDEPSPGAGVRACPECRRARA